MFMMNPGANSGVINNYFYTPEPDARDATKKAIEAFESKLQTNTESLEFTRKEVQLLAQALKELNQRTSAIIQLPDGRTMLGGFLSGSPFIAAEYLERALSNYIGKDFPLALLNASNAIVRYEESQKRTSGVAMSTSGDFTLEGKRTLYGIATDSAAKTGNGDLLARFGKKFVEMNESADPSLALTFSFLQLNRPHDAFEVLTNAMTRFPTNELLKQLTVALSGSDAK
jgi:hypothetical protein